MKGIGLRENMRGKEHLVMSVAILMLDFGNKARNMALVPTVVAFLLLIKECFFLVSATVLAVSNILIITRGLETGPRVFLINLKKQCILI